MSATRPELIVSRRAIEAAWAEIDAYEAAGIGDKVDPRVRLIAYAGDRSQDLGSSQQQSSATLRSIETSAESAATHSRTATSSATLTPDRLGGVDTDLPGAYHQRLPYLQNWFWALTPVAVTLISGLIAVLASDFSNQYKALSVGAVLCAFLALVAHSCVRLVSGGVRPWLRGCRNLLGGVAAVAILLTSVFALTGEPSLLRHAAKASATIGFPTEGDVVNFPFVVRGQAELPKDANLWLLIQDPDGNFRVAQDSPIYVHPDGDWEVYEVGRDLAPAGDYGLYLALVGPETGVDAPEDDPIAASVDEFAVDQFETYLGKTLPIGVRELNSVRFQTQSLVKNG